jgi:hypothetical protein
LTTPWPIGFKDDVEISAAHRVEPGARRHHAPRHVQPDLAPLVDEPSGNVFEGLVDIAVQQFETETLRSGPFDRRLASARDFSMSGQ